MVEPLTELCVRVIRKYLSPTITNLDLIPERFLSTVLKGVSPKQLVAFEELYDWLPPLTNDLWKSFVEREYPSVEQKELLNYRQVYQEQQAEEALKKSKIAARLKEIAAQQKKEKDSRKAVVLERPLVTKKRRSSQSTGPPTLMSKMRKEFSKQIKHLHVSNLPGRSKQS
jgi:hypothetical protein